MIRVHALTEATVADATTAIDLIETVDGDLTSVTADAAYDTVAFHDTAGARGAQFDHPGQAAAGGGAGEDRHDGLAVSAGPPRR